MRGRTTRLPYRYPRFGFARFSQLNAGRRCLEGIEIFTGRGKLEELAGPCAQQPPLGVDFLDGSHVQGAVFVNAYDFVVQPFAVLRFGGNQPLRFVLFFRVLDVIAPVQFGVAPIVLSGVASPFNGLERPVPLAKEP